MLAAVAAGLLLWCHGLQGTAHAPVLAVSGHAGVAGQTMMAAPAPLSESLPVLSCCLDGAGSNLHAAGLSRLPAPSAPLLAVTALLSALLAIVALRRPVLSRVRRRTLHRADLHHRATLFRI